MNKFQTSVVLLFIIAFCGFGILFSKSETGDKKQVVQSKSAIESTVNAEKDAIKSSENNDLFKEDITGEQELDGVLNEEVGKLVLFSFEYGNIFINVSDDKKEELKKFIGSDLTIKGTVVKKSKNVYEINVESFHEVVDVLDKEIDDKDF